MGDEPDPSTKNHPLQGRNALQRVIFSACFTEKNGCFFVWFTEKKLQKIDDEKRKERQA